MWITAQAVEGPAPAPAPPSFQVVLPPRAASPPLRLSPDDAIDVGGVTVVAPRAEPQWSRRLNLDPKGDFGHVATPYLTRMPHNECKLIITPDAAPIGVPGVAEAGKFACAFSFW